jgi:hypothetical protein
MLHTPVRPVRLTLDARTYARDFDRVPFGFDHDLSSLPLLGFDSIRALARAYEREYFVASGDNSPATEFYSAGLGGRSPLEALETLGDSNQRVLLKRPELYDDRFADLLRSLFEEIVDARGGLRGERVVRLMSSILISSSAAVTPFHFDPEITFFFQIEGEKAYHLYEPSVLTEPELERFYSMGIVNIGQVELAGRDPRAEHVFNLRAGKGLHQPQNCPHWVGVGASRSISYAVSFETDAMRARGRTRACNHYLRGLGLSPTPPGERPALDARKSAAMQAFIPLRKRLRNTLGGVLRRP